MAKVYEENIKIQKAKMAEVIDSCKIPKQRIDEMVLGRSSGYISKSLKNGTMGEGSFKKLCDFLGLDPEEYIDRWNAPPMPTAPAIQTTPLVTPAASGISDEKLDKLIELQTKQVELTKMLIGETQETNRLQHSLMSALASIINNSATIMDKQEEGFKVVEEGINKVASGLNLTNGRLKDVLFQKNPKGGTQ